MAHPINEVRYFFFWLLLLFGNHSGIELKARIPVHLQTRTHMPIIMGQPHNECRLHFEPKKWILCSLPSFPLPLLLLLLQILLLLSSKNRCECVCVKLETFAKTNANGSISRLATIWPRPISCINTFSHIFYPSIPSITNPHTRVRTYKTIANAFDSVSAITLEIRLTWMNVPFVCCCCLLACFPSWPYHFGQYIIIHIQKW